MNGPDSTEGATNYMAWVGPDPAQYLPFTGDLGDGGDSNIFLFLVGSFMSSKFPSHEFIQKIGKCHWNLKKHFFLGSPPGVAFEGSPNSHLSFNDACPALIGSENDQTFLFLEAGTYAVCYCCLATWEFRSFVHHFSEVKENAPSDAWVV